VKKELTKHRLEETDLVEDNRENEELQLPLLIFLEREKKEEKKARVIGKREKALYN
jgi:hypothetical protein